jgi:hypothetical protein
MIFYENTLTTLSILLYSILFLLPDNFIHPNSSIIAEAYIPISTNTIIRSNHHSLGNHAEYSTSYERAKTDIFQKNKRRKTSQPLMMTYAPPFTQVISDVDDTLKSSGGVKIGDIALGGIDVQYERGEFYPGVFQFMLEMSLSSLPPQKDGKLYPPKVAILTARAEEFKAALELKEDSSLGKAFQKAGNDMGIPKWGLGPVLYGSVAEWVIQERKGLRKFSNFERLIEQDPTGTIMQYVYVGDTGELDQEAGETMLREYPEVVKAVFLHVVSEQPYPKVPPPKLINGRPVIFFRTYVGAAAKATQLGLMSEDGLMRVVVAAQEALSEVSRSSDKWSDLHADVTEAFRTIKRDK